MNRYMCIHTFGPNAITRQQVQQFSQATQQSSDVYGIQSFVNLSEGKAVCIIEARDKSTLSSFFKKMGMPVDSICACEIEGEQGILHDVPEQPSAGLQA